MSDQVSASGPLSGTMSGPQLSGPMYKASHDDDRGIDPGTMKLLYGMGLGGVVILAGIAIYSLTGGHSGADLPVVQPDARPLRVKPDNAGGMQVGPETKQSNPNESRLAPSTEEPNPHALRAAPDPARPVAPPPPAPVAKTFSVQLANAKTENELQAAWDKLAKKSPDLLAQRRPLFLKTNQQGANAWRLRTGGFADAAQAKIFCDKLKAKGTQCSVAES